MPDAPIPLWPRKGDDPLDNPTLTLYRATAASGVAPCVLICPGGGYGVHAPHEGPVIAEWLNTHGFHAAILKYRLGPRHRHPAMANDAQRAMRLLRAHAAEWSVRPDAIAVLGFSAGGHLASTLAVHYDDFHCAADEYAGIHSARPDAAVLCYPVIDMAGAYTHAGSRGNLLGPEQHSEILRELMSTDRHVSAQTPPTFLWHTADDPGVPVENSLNFAAACRKNGVPVELHVYETGRHGLGLAHDDPSVRTWTDHCIAFLRRHLGRA